MENEVKRDSAGRFKKGSPSPNPGGRGNSKGIVAHVKSISNDLFDYIDILDSIARSDKTSNRDKTAAVRELLDRSIGKSPQYNINDNYDNTPYSKVIELVSKRISTEKEK